MILKNECGKLLGVKFDTKLTFENPITGICSRATRKVYVLTRVVPV